MSIRLFDGHCDTAFELWTRRAALSRNTCHIDLEKASSLNHYVQVFAFCSYAGSMEGVNCTQEEVLTLPLEKLRQEIAANAQTIGFAADASAVDILLSEGKTAALLSLEGPETIACDPSRLPWLQKQGFVMTTLTWNADNALAGCHLSDSGLTKTGEYFVRAAEEQQILIDVSHLSESAFWDLCRITKRPILASHSNCRSLCDHSRNLTDDQLRAVAATGGTVGLNLYPPFLGKSADFATLRAHLEHMLRLCGEQHVALGGDLDGCEQLAEGFTSLADYSNFYNYLHSCGYSEQLLDALFFENLMRLLRGRDDI